MATTFELILPFGYKDANRIASTAFEMIDQLESQLSIFRSNSEVSRINRIAHQSPVPVELSLYQLLERCAACTKRTRGAFDVTSGPLTQVWGFQKRSGSIPDKTQFAEALNSVGMHYVRLENGTIRFERRGVQLNLGSIGKGYALDRIRSRLIEKYGVTDALLSLGGSSIAAIGPRHWRVELRHPQSRRRLGDILLQDQAIGCSGSTSQHFRANGHVHGHIIDARSGKPAEGLLLSTVIATSGAIADALSTAFFVLGTDEASSYLECEGLACALFLTESDEVVSIGCGSSWRPATS